MIKNYTRLHSIQLFLLCVIAFSLCPLKTNANGNDCIVYGPDQNVRICLPQLPYTWNGNNYNAAGTYTVTLFSDAGCDSIVNLNLTVTETHSITNITACNSNLPYHWNGNNYNSSGSYQVTLISATGCDSVATLNLTVFPSRISVTSITICSPQLPFFWNGNPYSVAGAYHVTLVSSTGCDSIAWLDLVVNNVVTSATNITACNSQFPYTWNGQMYNTPGRDTVSLTSTMGCDSTAILVLRSENKWTGNINSSWEEPGNWGCGTVPDAYTNVVIESGTVVLSSNTTINSLRLNPIVNYTVAPGYQLGILQIAPL
jgi:hypothetical protein